MKKALITIHQNQFSPQQIKQLENKIKKNYRQFVSQERLNCIWCVVPQGQAFTDYQPSQSSLVTLECSDNFPQAKRIEMLKACERDWLAITAQHTDHLMLALVDQPLFKILLESNQNRFSLKGRLRMGLHLGKSFVMSKLRLGVLAFNPNL